MKRILLSFSNATLVVKNSIIFMVFLLFTTIMFGQSSTGWLSPSITKFNNGVTSSNNVFTSDNQRATWDTDSDFADYGNFNMNVPTGAIIDGIEVRVEGFNNRAFSFSCFCIQERNARIRLSWNNGSNFTNAKGVTLSTSENTYTIGANNDLWGHSPWTVDQLNNTNFRIKIEDDDGDRDMYIDHIQVNIHFTVAPVAQFNVNDTTPYTSETVTFTDLSTNNPSSWAWSFSPNTVSFQGGTNATSQNPKVKFVNAGLYTVTLTASNAAGNDIEVKTNYINVLSCTVSTFPYTQNFDSWSNSNPAASCTANGSVSLEDCWTNKTNDNIDWDIYSGLTPTGGQNGGNTGPSADHTSGGGKYLYTEASGPCTGLGYITTPVFDFSGLNNPELSFWYNMYGIDMGSLSVQVSTDGINWSGTSFSETGNKGFGWKLANVSLLSYAHNSNVQIRFRGQTGNGIRSDMAIDDVSVINAKFPASLNVSTLNDFGELCVGTTGGPESFTINGTHLTTQNVSVAAVTGFTYSTSLGGTYYPTLSLSQSGGTYSQIIYVKFNPAIAGPYIGTIYVSGGGAPSANVAVSANAIAAPIAANSSFPLNNATNVCYDGGGAVSSIAWNAVLGANSYDVYFGPGSLPTTVTQNVAGTSYNTIPLIANTSYYWKVVPKNSCGNAVGAETWSFTTASTSCSDNYCDITFAEVRSITRVDFGTIDNHSSPLTGSPSYENYTSISTDLTAGTSEIITVEGFTNGNNQFFYTVFFDWNQNGVFTDSGESYNIGTITNSTGVDGQQTSTSIAVPAGAVVGNTTMRIIGSYNGYNNDPCVVFSGEGQIEDYSVNIIPCVVGDPSLFGDDVWHVYAYNGDNVNLTGIVYAGYYTESNLSFNSQNQWGSNTSPSSATGYQGCPVTIDNHTVVYKRTNFTCGIYQIDVASHDDAARLYIDGVQIFEHIGCCDVHNNIWTGQLDASSTVEFRVEEQGGGSNGALTFTLIPTTAAFSSNTQVVQTGGVVNFTEESAGQIVSYAWSFSPGSVTYLGGTNSSSPNPQVKFNGLGSYAVNLTITDSCGAANTKNSPNYILVSNDMVFDADGTFIVPCGITSIEVKAWGGGGAGGGSRSTGFLQTNSGSGGQGGAFATNTIAVTPGAVLTIDVANSVSGINNGNGNIGRPSTILGFESQISAAGGLGGSRNATTNSPSGAGGSGANGGGSGGSGVNPNNDGNSGAIPGGGGSGSSTDSGFFGTNSRTGGNGASGRIILSWGLDAVPPVVNTQDILVQLDASGHASILTSDIDNGSFDSCGDVTFALDITNFNCSNVGPNTVTLTVTDLQGSISTGTAIVTVQDNPIDYANLQFPASAEICIGATMTAYGQVYEGGVTDTSNSPVTGIEVQFGYDTTNTDPSTWPEGNWTNATPSAGYDFSQNNDEYSATFGSALSPGIYYYTFRYSLTGCTWQYGGYPNGFWNGSNQNNGVLTVLENHSLALASGDTNQVTCPNTPISDIVYSFGGGATSTSISPQLIAGLTFDSVTGTISGTPTQSGVYNYTVTTVGNNCSTQQLSGTITVKELLDYANLQYPGTETICLGSSLTAYGQVYEPGVTPGNGSQGNNIAVQFGYSNSDSDPLNWTTWDQASFNPSGGGTNNDEYQYTFTPTLTGTYFYTFRYSLDGCEWQYGGYTTNGGGFLGGANVVGELTVNEAPFITTTYPNISTDTDSRLCGAVVNYSIPVVTGVPVPSVSYSHPSGTTFPLGVTTVTITATNSCGTDVKTFDVTVTDNEAPVALCQTLTVQLDASGNATIAATDIDNGSTDACGIASLSIDKTSFNCSEEGANTVTLTVTDNNGNVSTCQTTVTVEDNIAPLAICQAVTVQLDANGLGSISTTDVNAGSNDACGIQSMSLSQTEFSCSDIGSGNPPAINELFISEYIEGGSNNKCIEIYNGTGGSVNLATGGYSLFISFNGGSSTNTIPLSGTVANGDVFVICHSSATTIFKSQADVTTSDLNFNGDDAVVLKKGTSNIDVFGRIGQDPGAYWGGTGIRTENRTLVRNSNITAGNTSNLAGFPALQTEWTEYPQDTSSYLGSHSVTAVASGTEVTLTVTDNNGNVSSCTTTVTVIDFIAPEALCQPATIQLDASGNGSITAADIDNGSNDACGIASLSLDKTSFDCSKVGVNTVTLTVTDNNGNVSTCTTTVTVVDSVAPVALCQPFVLQLDASGNGTISAADVNNGSSDACGIASLSLDKTSFNCSEVGENTVTLTVTDNNGNVSTCNAIVTVADTVAPLAICQLVTVQLDANGFGSITTADVDAGSNDACGIQSLSLSQTEFSCSDIVTTNAPSINELFISEYIEGGGSNKCIEIYNGTSAPVNLANYTLKVFANASTTAPAISLSGVIATGDVFVICNPSASSAFTSQADQTSGSLTFNGNDAVVLYNSGTAIDIFGKIGQNPSQWSVGGNQTENRTLVRNANITMGNTDNATGFPTLGTEWTQYPQDTSTYLGSHSTTSAASGVEVTLTVTDNNGNISTCTTIVTVKDSVAPEALCQPVTIQLDASGNGTITAADIDNGSNDACGIASLSLDKTTFDCSEVGANTVTLTVTDNNGNVSTCTAIVTVEDTVAPVALCQPIVLQLDALGNGTISASDIDNGSNDACGIASLSLNKTTFDCSEVGANTVTLTVTDTNGNVSTCAAIVTVEDTVAPIAICQSLTVQLDDSGNVSITPADIDNGSNDACGIASLALDKTSFDCSEIGDNIVTLTVIDNNGNVSTCQATVTVEDNVAPVALCQSLTVQLDENGVGSITAQDLDNGSTDACGVASITASQTAFDCSNLGSNDVTLTVTDVNGNSSTCVATVTVVDSIAPIVNCLSLQVQLDAFGNGSIELSDINGNSTDNCGIASITLSQTDFTCDDIGGDLDELIISEYLDGTANNKWIEIYNGTGNEVVLGELVGSSIVSYYSLKVYYDGSSTPVTIGLLGTIADRDVYKVSHTNADEAGSTGIGTNLGTPALNFDGNDAIALTHNGTAIDIIGVIGATGPWSNSGVSTDNSTLVRNVNVLQGNINSFVANLATEWTQLPQNTYSNLGGHEIEITNQANNVILTVTDTSGNVSTCEGQVTVIDSVAPVAICQNVTVLLSEGGTLTASQVDNGSNDACGIASLTLSQTEFTCAEVGPNQVTLTVTDRNGNSSTCTSTITVVDDINPIVLTQDITVQLDANGTAIITANDVNNGSSDNCAIATLSVLPDNFTCANVGPNTVTLTATDVNGNVATATAIVTVEDNVLPNAVCQPFTIELDGNGVAIVTGADVDGGSNDACGIASLEVYPNVFGCGDIGVNAVVLTVTDTNGNVSTCSTTVTVTGIIPEVTITQSPLPEFCQGAVVVLTANSDEDFSYLWSTGETTHSIEVPGNGTYSVTVTSLTNCSTEATTTVTGFNAGSLISSYTIIATDNVDFNGGNLVQSGGVGVTKVNGKIKVHNASNIVGFAQASQIQINGGSSVGTPIYQPSNATIPAFVYNTYSNNSSPSVTINNNQTQTLTGAVYKKIELKDGATVIFTKPNVYIDELKTNKDATIEFSGCTNVFINDEFELGERGIINSNGYMITMYIDDDVEIEEGSLVNARIHANDNDIEVEGENAHGNHAAAPTYMNGMFIGKKVDGKKNVIWNSDSFCDPCPVLAPENNGGQEPTTDYTIIGFDEVHLHGDNIVQTGGVGVTRNNKKLKVHDDSHIDTFGKASQIHINGGSTVNTRIYSPADPIIPFFVKNLYSSNSSPDATINSGQTVTLTGSVYDKIDVKDGATVIFTQSNVYINELKTRKDVTIRFSGCTNVFIKKEFKLDDRGVINPQNHKVVIYVDDDVEINKGASIVASIYAHNDKITVDGSNSSPTSMRGLFIGKKVSGHENVLWNKDIAGNACPIVAPTNVPVNDGDDDDDDRIFRLEIKAWPNPSETDFNLKLITSDNTEVVQILVFDVNNKMVHSGEFRPDETYIFGNELQGGVYIVKVMQGKDVASTRVIKR